MFKILIWGTGIEYDRHMPYIELERIKGNLEVVGITSNDSWLCNIGEYKFASKDNRSIL